jgi:hypothetical protein
MLKLDKLASHLSALYVPRLEPTGLHVDEYLNSQRKVEDNIKWLFKLV